MSKSLADRLRSYGSDAEQFPTVAVMNALMNAAADAIDDLTKEREHWKDQSRKQDHRIIDLTNEVSMLRSQIDSLRSDPALTELLLSIDALRADLRASAQRQGTSNA